MNSIHVIAPYKYLEMWVFDDEKVVSGADTMIDRLAENIPNAEKGFILLFSKEPFPGAPPVMGRHWVADNGPSLHSHHRTGLFVAGGRAHISRRFAIDWKQFEQDAMYSGDARDLRSYFSFGENVYAVADATVVSAKDGLPDNILGPLPDSRRRCHSRWKMSPATPSC